MNDITKAIVLASEAHDKQHYGKLPYIFHPLTVAMKLFEEEEIIVAVLHDVVEDTPITLKDLHDKGFNIKIVEAIDAISKRKSETYFDYIRRIQKNELATRIKLADLSSNLNNLCNLKNEQEKEKFLRERYTKATNILREGKVIFVETK